jgi:hypothetical protein
MVSEGFAATPKDPAIYVKNSWTSPDFAAAGFWVDDCVAIGSRKELTNLARSVDAKYGTTGLGEVRWVLGMLLERDRPARTIAISQEAFIDSILLRFHLADATTVTTPLTPGTHLSSTDCPTSKDEIDEMANRPYRELVGALAWLALGTRPDIAFATSSLARFGHNPGRVHWDAAKRVLRYLKGTKGWRLTLGGKSPPEVSAYTDADWGSHSDDRRSIGAYVVMIGDGTVSWKSKKQSCVALSSTEAEYMALCQASKESVWMTDFLRCLGISLVPMVVNADNQGSIALAKNPVFHDRSKHIDIQYHYTRDLVKEKANQSQLHTHAGDGSRYPHEGSTPCTARVSC